MLVEILLGSAGRRSPTDLYIKFLPNSTAHLLALEEADLLLLDFPWTKDIVKQGDYYFSSPDSTDYPELYTTIPYGDPIPPVPYEVIAQLDMSETDPLIIQESFRLTGNQAEFDSTYNQNGLPDKLCLAIEKGGEECHEVGHGAGGGSGSGNPTTINECGCPISVNQREPGGCVEVFDTDFSSNQPVRRVRVLAKNGWFTWRRADTDDNGCWRINREFFGKAWFWVKFKDRVSNRGKFRFSGVDGWRFWQRAFTGKFYVGRLRGPVFNNIIVRFGAWTDGNIGSKVHYGWAGATINNALHEIYDVSTAEGFTLPPKNLNVLIQLGTRRGFATMLRQMGSTNFVTAVNHGIGFWAPNAVGLSTGDVFGALLVDATGGPNWPATSLVLNTFIGDINTGGNFISSSRMKKLAYHEFAHGSHYANTNALYWRRVIAAEVGAFGHGDPTVNLAGHIQIAESWAEHIGLTTVVDKYPIPISRRTGSGTFLWVDVLERTRNESLDHIPIGLYNDLIDGSSLETVFDDDNTAFFSLNDGVSGAFTNAILDDIIGEKVKTISELLQEVQDRRPGTTTAQQIQDLFDEY